jgi:hypothetical protein
MKTHKEQVCEEYGLDPKKSYSLETLSDITKIPLSILDKVYDRGLGAWGHNNKSVRLKGSYVKNVATSYKYKLSAPQWASARCWSFINGNPKHDNDLRRND